MGLRFRIEIDNQARMSFEGQTHPHGQQCMLNVGNLNTLQEGVNVAHLEFDTTSTGCVLANRYLWQGFKVPGSDDYAYQFVFLLLSRGAPRPQWGPQWFWAETAWEGRTAVLGIRPDGIRVQFTSIFKECGEELCLAWAIQPPPHGAALAPASAVHDEAGSEGGGGEPKE
jgi:hypothetical protein